MIICVHRVAKKGGKYHLLHGNIERLEAKYVEPYFEHIWNECEGNDCQKCQTISDQIHRACKKEKQ